MGDNLEENNQLFYGRKRVIVGETDRAVEIFATAFVAKMHHFIMLGELGSIHRVMMMVVAMLTKLRSIAKAAHQMIFIGTIVEVDIPAYRDEEHHERHQQGTDFQQVRFHAAKVIKKS